MTKVIIYTTDYCPYCVLAKKLLAEKNVDFTEIRIDQDEAKREEMMKLSNRKTVPQIFINDESIGGYDDLAELVRSGKLGTLLQSSN